MAASISFTDAAGAATLQSAWTGPSARFHDWQPTSLAVGDKAAELGSGIRHAFVFREQDGARFSLQGIRPAHLETALRLQRHLDRGGTVTVATGDSESHSYTCCQTPDTDPAPPVLDRERYEYSMSFDLINVGTPGPMVCRYFDAPVPEE